MSFWSEQVLWQLSFPARSSCSCRWITSSHPTMIPLKDVHLPLSFLSNTHSSPYHVSSLTHTDPPRRHCCNDVLGSGNRSPQESMTQNNRRYSTCLSESGNLQVECSQFSVNHCVIWPRRLDCDGLVHPRRVMDFEALPPCQSRSRDQWRCVFLC